MDATTLNATTLPASSECSDQTPYTASDMWVPITYVAVVLIFSIVGNSLVLFIYSCRWQSTGATKVYVCTLAILDLLAAFIMMPHQLITFAFVSPRKLISMHFDLDVFCKFTAGLGNTLYLANALILVSIALSRFFKVSKLLRVANSDDSKGKAVGTLGSKLSILVTSNRGAKVASLASVLLALLLSLPAIWLHKNVPEQDCLFHQPVRPDFSCYLACGFSENAVGFLAFNMASFVCTCLAIFCLYSLIYYRVKVLERNARELKRQNCRSVCLELSLHPHTPSGNGKAEFFPQLSYPNLSSSQPARDSTQQAKVKEGDGDIRLGSSTGAATQYVKVSRKSRNITLMLLIITLVFTLSYLPFFILNLVELEVKNNNRDWCDMSTDKLIAFELFSHSFLISNAVNPFVYGFCDPTFRRMLWKTVRWRRDVI